MFMSQHCTTIDVQSYHYEDSEKLKEFLYDEFVFIDQRNACNFDSIDAIIIHSENDLVPWLASYEYILCLVKQCVLVNKHCYLMGTVALFLSYVVSTTGMKISVFNNSGYGSPLHDLQNIKRMDILKPWHMFYDNDHGDLYVYDNSANLWIPTVSVGFKKCCSRVKTPFYTSNDLKETDKNMCVKIESKHVQHYMMKDLGVSYPCNSYRSTFSLCEFELNRELNNITNCSSGIGSLKVIMQHSKGPCVFEFRNIVANILQPKNNFLIRKCLENFTRHILNEFFETEYIKTSIMNRGDSVKPLSIYKKIHMDLSLNINLSFTNPAKLIFPYSNSFNKNTVKIKMSNVYEGEDQTVIKKNPRDTNFTNKHPGEYTVVVKRSSRSQRKALYVNPEENVLACSQSPSKSKVFSITTRPNTNYNYTDRSKNFSSPNELEKYKKDLQFTLNSPTKTKESKISPLKTYIEDHPDHIELNPLTPTPDIKEITEFIDKKNSDIRKNSAMRSSIEIEKDKEKDKETTPEIDLIKENNTLRLGRDLKEKTNFERFNTQNDISNDNSITYLKKTAKIDLEKLQKNSFNTLTQPNRLSKEPFNNYSNNYKYFEVFDKLKNQMDLDPSELKEAIVEYSPKFQKVKPISLSHVTHIHSSSKKNKYDSPVAYLVSDNQETVSYVGADTSQMFRSIHTKFNSPQSLQKKSMFKSKHIIDKLNMSNVKSKNDISSMDYKMNMTKTLDDLDVSKLNENKATIHKTYNSSTGIKRKFYNNKLEVLKSLSYSKVNPWDRQGPTVNGNDMYKSTYDVQRTETLTQIKSLEGKKTFHKYFGSSSKDKKQFDIPNYVGASPADIPFLEHKFRDEKRNLWVDKNFK